MNHKKSRTTFYTCLYIGLALILITAVTKAALWPCILGGAVIFAGLIQAAIFYRCPHCHKSLELRGKAPQHCPNCGEKIS